MKLKIGTILLALFLIIYGLAAVVHLSFEGMNYILGGIAIAAGIFILIDR